MFVSSLRRLFHLQGQGIIAVHGSPLRTNQSIFRSRTHARNTHAGSQGTDTRRHTFGPSHCSKPSQSQLNHPRLHDNSPPLISVHLPSNRALTPPPNPDLDIVVSEPWPIYPPPCYADSSAYRPLPHLTTPANSMESGQTLFPTMNRAFFAREENLNAWTKLCR